MRARPIRLLVVLGIVLFSAGCVRESGASDPKPPATMVPDVTAIDALAADYRQPQAPGASVVVIHQGKVAFQRAYGLAHLETREPATVETNYRLASLTKQFTATAILLLIKDGKLRYEDRAVDVLPGFPAYARDVRIRHLLNHTSGIWDYEDFVPETQREQVTDEDVLTLVGRAGRVRFPPGSAVRYSNSGYAVLARVVEQVSGKPFAAFLRERIFEPLAMNATVAHQAGVSTVPHRAYGYVADGKSFRPRDQSPTSAVLGDGGVYSSVVDLVAWDRAIESHTLLPAAMQGDAFASARLSDGSETHYGFGWFSDEDEGRTRLTHHGETSGFTNAIIRYPDQRLTVIVLTNRAGGEPWNLAQRIADMWLGARRTTPPRKWPFEAMPNSR